MSGSGKRADYSIGFGKPPEQHRFKKGQTGNPKGRSKKGKEPPVRFGDGVVDNDLVQEAFRQLQLHENGRPVRLRISQAIVRSLLLDGLKGNRLAKRYAFELLRREEREALERSAKFYKSYVEIKAKGEALIQRCRTEGRAPPRFYPHPDDILLDEANLEVHLLGPRSEDQAIPYIRAALMRDWFLARSMLDKKCGTPKSFEWDELRGDSAPGVFAGVIETGLPPSFQRSEGETRSFVLNLTSLTKRQLLNQMDVLMREAAQLPPTIAERLEARKRASMVLEIFGAALKGAAEVLARQESDELAPEADPVSA